MTLQNRVLPTGEIVSDPARGTVTGNRGVLHDADRRLGAARWRHPHWICCRLEFRGRRRVPMTPGRWTELFFLDEAVALAAGHRPCAECRRADWLAFRAAWERVLGPGWSAPAIDRALHAARVEPRSRAQLRHAAPLDGLPKGTFILHAGAPHLVREGALLPYAPGGYRAPLPRPRGAEAVVLTPAPTVAVLAAGYRAALHPSAG